MLSKEPQKSQLNKDDSLFSDFFHELNKKDVWIKVGEIYKVDNKIKPMSLNYFRYAVFVNGEKEDIKKIFENSEWDYRPDEIWRVAGGTKSVSDYQFYTRNVKEKDNVNYYPFVIQNDFGADYKINETLDFSQHFLLHCGYFTDPVNPTRYLHSSDNGWEEFAKKEVKEENNSEDKSYHCTLYIKRSVLFTYMEETGQDVLLYFENTRQDANITPKKEKEQVFREQNLVYKRCSYVNKFWELPNGKNMIYNKIRGKKLIRFIASNKKDSDER